MKTLIIKIWLKLTTPLECYLARTCAPAWMESVLGQAPYYVIHDFNNKLWRSLPDWRV